MWPVMNIGDVVGAVHLPKDGIKSPIDTTLALAKGARLGGARVIEGMIYQTLVRRNPDVCAYFKEDAGKLSLGCFEPVAKPWDMEGIPDFGFDQLP